MGGVLKYGDGVMDDPAILYAPAEIWLGKHGYRATTFIDGEGNRGRSFSDLRVVAFEDVAVSAGSFKAYRVDFRGQRNGDKNNGVCTTSYRTGTCWVDPRTMMVIKQESIRRRAGRMEDYSREQLVSYKPASR